MENLEDKIERYKSIIEKVFNLGKDYSTLDKTSRSQIIINQEKTNFIHIMFGWEEGVYEYGVLFHVELKADGKVWIHYNSTDILIDLIRNCARSAQTAPKSTVWKMLYTKFHRIIFN